MRLMNFEKFEKMHEAENVLCHSPLNEGEFDQFAKTIALTNKEDIVKLNPMLVEYMKIKKNTSTQRIKIEQDILKETDTKKKEDLNNSLVKINQDEEKKVLENEKKLAKWVDGKQATLNFLMRSKLEEIDLEIMEDAFKKQQTLLSDIAKKRQADIIKIKHDELKARAEKMKKMIDDEAADTKSEDDKIVKSETKEKDVEQDYDADGKLTSDEKKVRKQKEKDVEKSPLNQL